MTTKKIIREEKRRREDINDNAYVMEVLKVVHTYIVRTVPEARGTRAQRLKI